MTNSRNQIFREPHRRSSSIAAAPSSRPGKSLALPGGIASYDYAGVALLAFTLAVFCHYLTPFLGADSVLLLFLPFLSLAALRYGRGPIFLLLLGTALLYQGFVQPVESLGSRLIHLTELLVLGTVMALGAEHLHQARVRAETDQQEKTLLLSEMQATMKRQRRFIREVLENVTEGRLHLCDAETDLPERLASRQTASLRAAQGTFPVDTIELTGNSLAEVRRRALHAANMAGLSTTAGCDLMLAASEAAMNALVHGNGGTAEIGFDIPQQRVQIRITDRGPGIPEEMLHRATLERGFSTRGTLGQGFWMMVQTTDHLYLLTGPGGTTVIMEQFGDDTRPLVAHAGRFVQYRSDDEITVLPEARLPHPKENP